MSPTVLLLFAFLLGESFAGYSTGFNRTPKPKGPALCPCPDGVPIEGDKIDDGGIVIDGGRDEEKEVPHDLPELPPKEDTSVILDDKTVKEPDYPEGVPPRVGSEEQQPIEPGKDDVGVDLPGVVPLPNPDTPQTHEDEKIPPGSYPDGPSPDLPDRGADYDFEGPGVPPATDEEGAVAVGPLPYPHPGQPPIPPGDVIIVPPGDKIEVLEPYPVRVGNGNINLYELMEKLELSRFLHLVEEAGLKDLLTGEGPLTIFAPSDYALSKLDANTIRTLATNQELLRQFVLYHIVDGQIYGPSFDERDNSAVVTKFDRAIHINKYGSTLYVNGVPITTRDQICRNGVIHILDSALYPFPSGNLMETLEKQENFKIYTELIRNAKLDNELTGNEAYTIIVPTDAAFSKLPPANLEWLKWDIPAIKRMFRQLTVRGTYYTPWIQSGNGQLTSINGETKLSFSGYPDSMNVNGVPLSQFDVTATNGCIQAIDDIWFLSDLGTPSQGSKKKD